MFKFIKEIKSPADRFYLALMIFAICEQTIFVFPILLVTRMVGGESMYNIVVTLIYVLLTLGAISNKRLKCLSPFTILVIVFFFLSIALTYSFHPECSKYLSEGWHSELKTIIPWFLLGTCYYADDISMETIGKWCSLGVVFLSWYLLISNNQLGETQGEYDMQASYRLLLSTLITINYAFTSKNKWAIAASGIGILYSFAMGTRGPVLVIFAFVVILFAQKILEKGLNKFWLFFLLSMGVVAFSLIGALPIITYLQGLLSSAGFSTRVFDMALNDEILQSNSRQMIYETLINKLQEDPMPHGLYAEKLLGFFSAHNMYIEILFYYGIFLGFIILLVLILVPIISYRRSTNPLAKQWIVMFVCCVFIHGIWGGKFFSQEVFFMLGFCIKEIQINRYKRIILK